MYRCTECNTEYTECPEFCECGNDSFEEIYEDDSEFEEVKYDEYQGDEELIPPSAPPVKKKRKMTPEEAAEYFAEQKEKKKSLIAAGVFIFLTILAVFAFPPYVKPKMEAVKEKVAAENIKIPSVDTYWDDTLPSAFKKDDKFANLPVLNKNLSYISPVLKDYLSEIGKEFDRKWDKSIIQPEEDKNYTTTVVFTINKEGLMDVKRIAQKSHNDSLDNSVSLALTNMNSVEIPPDDYKGEKIYITFNYDKNKNTYIKYPQVNK
jgi:hypothetical protein